MIFCYFSESILSLKSYYRHSYVSVWLIGILLTIGNILIKSWNVHVHFALDWSNAAWPIWWLKQSIKPCKLNESLVAITNMSCVYLLTFVWVFWTFYLPWLYLFKSWFYEWDMVEFYIKDTSWKKFYLVTPSRLIRVYFIIPESLNRN